jgi:hypothetical protein
MLNNVHVVFTLSSNAKILQKPTQFCSNIMCTIIIVLLLKAPVEHLPITYNLTIMLKQLQTSSN